MFIPVPINISANFSTGILTHNVLSPPQIPSPVPMMSMEMLATQWWPPGYAMNQNKLTRTVRHKKMSIVQSGHDCGMMIMDVTPPMPGNVWYSVMWPFSSRKISFAASTVKMDGTPTGCAFGPLFPMMTCGEPASAPTARVHPTQLLNNVYVGMTLGDILRGVAMIALEMAVDLVLEYGFNLRALKKWGKGFVRTVDEAADLGTKQMLEEMAEGTFKSTSDRIGKGLMDKMGLSADGAKHKALDSVCGFSVSTTTDNPTVKYGVGAPTANAGVSLSKEKGFVAEGSYMGVQADTTGKVQAWGEPLP